MKKHSQDNCPLCRGEKSGGKTTFTVDLSFGVVVVRNVPATVCSQCSADWISNEVSIKLEKIVKEAREKKNQVEITSYEKLAS